MFLSLLLASYILLRAIGVIGIWVISVYVGSESKSLFKALLPVSCFPQKIISGIRPFFFTCFWSIVRRSRIEFVTFNLDQAIMWKQESQSHWSGPYFYSPGRYVWYFIPHFYPSSKWLSSTSLICCLNFSYSGVNWASDNTRKRAIKVTFIMKLIIYPTC